MYKQVNKNIKKFCKCRSLNPGLPNYNQLRFALNSADAVEISNYPKPLKIQRWAQITSYQKRSATIFLTSKSAVQNTQFNFLLSETQRSFRNELFDSVEAQRNSAIVEQHFHTKLKCNLTFAIETSQNNANTVFLAILN